MTARTIGTHRPISVVMMTRNEAHNIRACLESLSDFEEILVVDNGSTDDTCAIVSSFPNAKLIVSEWKGYGGTRQVGVDAATHDWILWFDADERMSTALANEIRKTLANADDQTLFSIPRQNYFLGRPIHGCGWSPDHVNRVFNRRICRFNDKTVHEGITSDAQLQKVTLKQPIIHFSYISIKQFFDKNNRYAQLAGAERRRISRHVYTIELFIRPVWEFFRSYILKRGFADGLRGLVISVGAAVYVFTRDASCLLENNTKDA